MKPAQNFPAATIVSQNSIVEVIADYATQQRSLHALKSFNKNELICHFYGKELFTHPTYLTIQLALNRHISLAPDFLQYCNHSCEPNIFFNTSSMEIIAIKDIKVNDELCFFYPSTEWEMADPFLCYCGSRNCLRNIAGANRTPLQILLRYRLTDFIQHQLNYYHSL